MGRQLKSTCLHQATQLPSRKVSNTSVLHLFTRLELLLPFLLTTWFVICCVELDPLLSNRTMMSGVCQARRNMFDLRFDHPSSFAYFSRAREQANDPLPLRISNPPAVIMEVEASRWTQPLASVARRLNVHNPPDVSLFTGRKLFGFIDTAVALKLLSVAERVSLLKRYVLRGCFTRSQLASSTRPTSSIEYRGHVGGATSKNFRMYSGGSRAAINPLLGLKMKPVQVRAHLFPLGHNHAVTTVPNATFAVFDYINPTVCFERQGVHIQPPNSLQLKYPLSDFVSDFKLSRPQLVALASRHPSLNMTYIRTLKKVAILDCLKKHICTAECSDCRVICHPLEEPATGALSPRQQMEDIISGAGRLNIPIPLQDVRRHAIFFDGVAPVLESHDCFHIVNYKGVNPDFLLGSWDNRWNQHGFVPVCIPIPQLLQLGMKHKQLEFVAQMHGFKGARGTKKELLEGQLRYHDCTNSASRCKQAVALCKGISIEKKQPDTEFPPKQDWKMVWESRISAFSRDIDTINMKQVGCVCCGQLTSLSNAFDLNGNRRMLKLMVPSKYGLKNVSRVERKLNTGVYELAKEIKGPLMASNCKHFCPSCHESLSNGKLPDQSLANGNWIGDVPEELRGLMYAEKLLITRARYNYCVVRVQMGGRKLRANAIAFANPSAKIYDILPPPKSEIENVLAILFVGKCKPTSEDLKRTPLFVRHSKVHAALQWLMLNHQDYQNVTMSQANLDSYNDLEIPVSVEWLQSASEGNVDADAVASYQEDGEEGTENGMCSFSVQGLTDDSLAGFKHDYQYKAEALKHLNSGGKVLAVGHSDMPETLYNNPSLYPRMFPWLFPYGLGGIGNMSCISGEAKGVKKPKPSMPDKARRQALLSYYDKRFQTDEHFALVAFNHQQIRDSSCGASLFAKKSMFQGVVERLHNVDIQVLDSLSERMKHGPVRPANDEEKLCFDLLSDLDHVAHRVDGSLTSKKYMRNEIWSLVSHVGAPMWFITFAPDDSRHPLSLYLADTNDTFRPELLSTDERQRMIANNPVASALFFHKTVELFLKHILGLSHGNLGIFGETEAFYGAVEQQGRLTLHLHLLLWIRGALSPKEIRDRLSDPDSAFRKELVSYLEYMHAGQMHSGSKQDVADKVSNRDKHFDHDPRTDNPMPPSRGCTESCGQCAPCLANASWWVQFREVTDHLMFRCNEHSCSKNAKCTPKFCKGRFPKDVVNETVIDDTDGHITMKHKEAMFNNINSCLTYLIRCNSDVSCMLSGSSVKAVVAYVTDYITKPTLKTYGVFDAMRAVITKKSQSINGTLSAQDHAKKLVTGIVNALTAKMEIGSVFAVAYMMDLPDHFKSHTFVPFYWRQYVKAVEGSTSNDIVHAVETSDSLADSIFADDEKGRIVSTGLPNKFALYSSVQDYMLRPIEHGDVSLHDWVTYSEKTKLTPQQTSGIREHDLGDHDEMVGFVNNYVFLKGHPQRLTHKTCFSRQNTEKLPNFTTPLPRSDRGDRDYYCKTMLTFFKPWRRGSDLKCENDSWSFAFDRYAFSASQKKLLKNFNVRYECYDARDEYSAQQKAQQSGAPNWMTDEVLENIEHANYLMDSFESVRNDIDEMTFEGTQVKGKVTLAKEADMIQMKRILQGSGWLDNSVDGIPSLPENGPAIVQDTPANWAKLLDTAKAMRLKEKVANCVRVPNTSFNSSSNVYENVESDLVDIVKVVDKAYLEEKFLLDNRGDRKIIDSVIKEFCLNTEQKRAFKIIANHASTPGLEQLRMYLGGMGGTGKSQVVKAVIKMFDLRNESHRFIIVAPTGAAASLLNGSTYHSALGITGNGEANATSSSKMKTRLQGVEYMFLDEVSMLSCSKLYEIARKLAERNTSEVTVPFGGMNVIFAGDFAQLPPVFEGPAYALYSGSLGQSGKREGADGRNYQLHSLMGKTLWQQVTTVVILRQNMRQTKQTQKDAKYRTALVNMRFGACTDDDITFLKSLVARPRNKALTLAQKKYVHVPIILTRNIQRDKVNELGCQKFAVDNDLSLQSFYSDDEWLPPHEYYEGTTTKKKGGRIRNPPPGSLIIDPRLQKHIWSLPHSVTDHKPGCLTLCRGMPVMVKYNVATECCVTNGAEATVVGWQCHQNTLGNKVLDVLFVKLKEPPRSIQLRGLPKNVVPIVPISRPVKCRLGDDRYVYIRRKMVPVLPNFAMTDYCSQGRTRKFNVVHLESSKNTLASVYTALSRSSAADNTIITQGFNLPQLQDGVSGYLRQEYRELEMLDHITLLRYKSRLPAAISGFYRNSLIAQYRSVFGKHHVPKHVHPSIKWEAASVWLDHIEPTKFEVPKSSSKGEAKRKIDDVDACEGRYSCQPTVHAKKVKVTASPICEVKHLKRKRRDDTVAEAPPSKKIKLTPQGIVWDATDWSCAYDSVLYILLNLWNESSTNVRRSFKRTYPVLDGLSSDMDVLSRRGDITPEAIRDRCRDDLFDFNPDEFQRRGHRLASAAGVARAILRPATVDNSTALATLNLECCNCSRKISRQVQPLSIGPAGLHWNDSAYRHPVSVANLLCRLISGPTSKDCVNCDATMDFTVDLCTDLRMSPIITVDLAEFRAHEVPEVNLSLKLKDRSSKVHTYRLKGIVYYKDKHFTATCISNDGSRWWNDGIALGSKSEAVSRSNILYERGAVASLLIYALSM